MLDDKYRIDELLAVGGMGAVYVGTHIKLRKRVALKVLNPALSTPPMIERFHREAITASQIGHEGIAQVTDLGTSAGGEPFLVMELLEGESLATRLRHAGALPIDIACELGCMILSPLEAAHRAGIIHRDLKPDNVFLVRQSRNELVKLLDFGISRAVGLEGEFRLTTTGLVLGTPYYMSPEQARGDSAVTRAADLYSFGVILYEMLVGQVPITGDNYNQLMYRVMSGDYQPPRERRPEIPVELEQLILGAMALDPLRRPGSAAELERALLAFCRPAFREHVEATSGPFMRATPYPTPSAYPPSIPPVLPRATTPNAVEPRSKLPWILGGAIAVIAIVGGIIASQGHAPAPPPAPTPVATPAPLAPAPTPAPAPAAPATQITLRFEVQPASAEITLDGKPVPGAELVVARDGASHHLHIAAAGYVGHDEDLKFDENQRLAVVLEPAPASHAAAAAPHPATHAPKQPPTIESESPYGN
jgi:eukaryotic-like serine/threonine-protein kinase